MKTAIHETFIPEIEGEVLGSLLMTGDIKNLPAILRPDHFLHAANRRIFETMLVAAERYRSTRSDIVLPLMAEGDGLRAFQKLYGLSLPEYLAQLITSTVRGAAGLKDTVPAVLHQWARFAVAGEAERIAIAAADPAADPGQLIKVAALTFDEVASCIRSSRGRKTAYTLGEAVDAAIDAAAEAMKAGTGLTGTTWGLSDIDRATGGLQPGEMTILGARPSMGKTAVGLSIGIRAAQSGAGVGFFSLEMGAKYLGTRAATDLVYDRYGSIAYTDLKNGRSSDADIEKFVGERAHYSSLPLLIDDAAGLSVSEIRTKAERMMEAADRSGAPLKVLMVDYLQLVTPSSRYQGNRVAEVSEISAGLRNIARDFSISVVALSQLSRQVESREDKRPMLSDLRDSGSLEQDADTVAFLYRPAYYLSRERGKTADAEVERLEQLAEVENKLEFIIAKQRTGPTKTIDLFIDVAASAVRNAARA